MARNNPKVSPEAAVQFVEVARQMRRLIYGVDGVPVWGTKFSAIEAEALEIGRELSRLIMEQSVDDQSERLPPEALRATHSGGETAAVIGEHPSLLETTAGDVQWQHPKARLSKARRDFFPSVPSVGR